MRLESWERERESEEAKAISTSPPSSPSLDPVLTATSLFFLWKKKPIDFLLHNNFVLLLKLKFCFFGKISCKWSLKNKKKLTSSLLTTILSWSRLEEASLLPISCFFTESTTKSKTLFFSSLFQTDFVVIWVLNTPPKLPTKVLFFFSCLKFPWKKIGFFFSFFYNCVCLWYVVGLSLATFFMPFKFLVSVRYAMKKICLAKHTEKLKHVACQEVTFESIILGT